jgi:SAM-dependent methyltransferase
MNPVFDAYAKYYDLLYRDKDYAAEAVYVAAQIRQYSPNAKHILDLGCGTGAHAEHLARMGFVVHGVDQSPEMLARAQARKVCLPPEIAARLSFSSGDIRSIRMNETYDVVTSLFHVMSYQTTNTDLEAVFETAAIHLEVSGLFLFDFWYGPAVLSQQPEVKVKRLEDDEVKITRIAEPVMHENENVVNVNYTVFIEIKNTGKVEQVRESHKMRYLFLPELLELEGRKFKECVNKGWMTNTALSVQTWAGFLLCRLIQ